MSKNINNGHDGVEQQALHAFTESAYLDYSMYVILDRALPHLADGLKPVQRRIIYAMSELGLSSQAKFKKSARTVGDVLGKFHPHGDSACYEAMVLMAQSFSYRYPFVDGQGNWGSMDDPKSFAAMRYTEARLSAYADVLLKELGQGTVEWSPNFDGSLDEPNLLPARLPNILLNGASGIAVGMSTDIPPHNLIEVTNACIHLLSNPNASADDLCQFVKGPDYPSDAEIISSPEDIRKIYTSGGGGLRMRAVYHTENGDIVITALPHLVSGSKILEQIAQLMQNKKVLQISDLRDESDHEHPIRLIITPKNSKTDNQALMNQLFASTDLERTYRVNVNVIGLDNKPKVKNLSVLLSEWLQFRQLTVLKRLQTRLQIVVKRLHILDGLLICYLRLDDVIALIRQSDEAKLELIKQFKLSETQAEAILELKLRQLAKLEEHKIKSEQAKLVLEKAELDELIDNPRKLKNLIKKELERDAKIYGNPRRSRIIERPAAQALAKEIAPEEPVTVVLSKQAWIRSAKGHEIDPMSLSYKSGDAYEASVTCMSRTPVVFIDNFGRAYTLLPNSLPSARGQGEPLSTKVDLPDGAKIKALIAATKTSQFLLLSSAGYGFKIQFQDMLGKNKKGKGLLNLSGQAELSYANNLDNKANRLVLLTLAGQLLIVSIAELPVMSKGKGSRIIHLKKGDELCSIIALKPGQGISLSTGKKVIKLKATELKEYCADLGSKGTKLKSKITHGTILSGN